MSWNRSESAGDAEDRPARLDGRVVPVDRLSDVGVAVCKQARRIICCRGSRPPGRFRTDGLDVDRKSPVPPIGDGEDRARRSPARPKSRCCRTARFRQGCLQCVVQVKPEEAPRGSFRRPSTGPRFARMLRAAPTASSYSSTFSMRTTRQRVVAISRGYFMRIAPSWAACPTEAGARRRRVRRPSDACPDPRRRGFRRRDARVRAAAPCLSRFRRLRRLPRRSGSGLVRIGPCERLDAALRDHRARRLRRRGLYPRRPDHPILPRRRGMVHRDRRSRRPAPPLCGRWRRRDRPAPAVPALARAWPYSGLRHRLGREGQALVSGLPRRPAAPPATVSTGPAPTRAGRPAAPSAMPPAIPGTTIRPLGATLRYTRKSASAARPAMGPAARMSAGHGMAPRPGPD